jgi:predicted kinase
VREEIYTREFGHRTYSRLADCAESCLRAGLSVIVDAAFLDATNRHLFRLLAERLGAQYAIVSCEADAITLAQRVAERSDQRTDASDATLSVLDAQLREVQPFAPAEQPCVIHVETEQPHAVRRVAEEIRARCGGPEAACHAASIRSTIT